MFFIDDLKKNIDNFNNWALQRFNLEIQSTNKTA